MRLDESARSPSVAPAPPHFTEGPLITSTVSTLPLAGMSALVTGGSGSIGAACAAKLLQDGCSVTLLARHRDALKRTRDRLLPMARGGAQIRLVEGDALIRSDVQAAVAATMEINGTVNICVATVGGGSFKPLLMQDEDSVMDKLAYNIKSAFLAIRHCIAPMAANGGGSIVLISSEAARMPADWVSIYSTAKAGVDGLVRASASELSRYKIRVNGVRPGLTRAETTQFAFHSEESIQKAAAKYPLARLGEPEDIAAGVRYLAGPESSWVTAQCISVDGGGELRSPANRIDLLKLLRQA